jgi:hypothetical protein
MQLTMGGQYFRDVQVPVLWGERAVIQDEDGRLSVIFLREREPVIEILGDMPGPNVDYLPTSSGFEIHKEGKPLYSYDPARKVLRGITLSLPECEIAPMEIRVGSDHITGNTIEEAAVGIAITENAINMRVPLPQGLTPLVDDELESANEEEEQAIVGASVALGLISLSDVEEARRLIREMTPWKIERMKRLAQEMTSTRVSEMMRTSREMTPQRVEEMRRFVQEMTPERIEQMRRAAQEMTPQKMEELRRLALNRNRR